MEKYFNGKSLVILKNENGSNLFFINDFKHLSWGQKKKRMELLTHDKVQA